MEANKKMDMLIRPRSVAIMGCSENNIGGRVLQNLLKSKLFHGPIYPISLKQESILGVKCYKSIADIPGDVDCCVIALRSTLIPNALDEVHAKGTQAVVMFASGFSELGIEGKKLQEVVSAKLKTYPAQIGLWHGFLRPQLHRPLQHRGWHLPVG